MDASFKEERPPNPRATASIFNILTFGWTINLFKKGQNRDLEVSDLYKTLDEHTSTKLGNELEKKWRIELIKAKKMDRQPSLLRALIRVFGAKILFFGIFILFIETFFCVCQPYLLGLIIAHFDPDSPSDQSNTPVILYGIFLILTCALKTIGFTSYDMLTVEMGMKIRVSVCSVIYNKALRLSKTALNETTAGQVVNLLSNDVNRFDMAIFFLHYLWIGPLEIVLVTYFLWQEIDVSSIVGVIALLLFIPLQGWLGKKTSELRLKTAGKTDERIRLMNEILTGIQVIKMYTWEKPFAYLVEFARKKEIQQLRKTTYYRAILSSFMVFQTKIALFFSILSYVLLGNYIDAKKVFVITLYYKILQVTMTIFFPQGIGIIAETLISIKRLEKFLLFEEKISQVANLSKSDKIDKINGVNSSSFLSDDFVLNQVKNQNITDLSNDAGVIISNVTAKWTDDQIENSLENINITVKPGELVAIIGPVGGGKSSLIQAILQELPLSRGSISMGGVVSYASQEAWLFSATVQQNILFGLPMDRDRYKKVVKVCALKTDFEQFPYGDRTIVGERGVSLSGGQKARINLARAVYKQANVYLLDDPLSAVDTHVGKHLFEKCIKGYLKNKTCILITHQLQYLSDVEKIILIENGKISADGSYQQLRTSGLDFTNLLKSLMKKGVLSDNEITSENESAPNFSPSTVLTRYNSLQSIASIDSKQSRVQAEPVEIAETRSFGGISLNVYSSYLAAGGNSFLILFLLFICVLTQVIASGGDYWITYWVNLEDYVFRNSNVTALSTNNSTSTSLNIGSTDTLLWWTISRQTCIIVFVVLTFATVAAALIRSTTFVTICMRASSNLHNKMFNAITRATMYFFNTNSSGRILNRFSNDMGAIDDRVIVTLMDSIQIGLSIMGIVIIVALLNIYLMIPTIIVGLIFSYLRVIYISTSRSIKRLEGVTRSPVIAHLNASIQGLTTIRAFGVEQILAKEFNDHQDLHSSAWYLFIAMSRAFGLWLDVVCIFYISVVIFSFILGTSNTSGGDIGLAITQTIGLTGLFQFGMRQSAELENQMTSVERVLEYTNAPQEPTLESPPDEKPPKGWPSKGQIVFQNFFLRYSPDTPYVLKNLSLTIDSMEKIGIVGRTGAGKSSLIGALFRLALNEGYISIDNIEIHKFGLHDVRSKISIIPQEPFLFSGTMRKNLDPFDEYSDHALWKALDEVELKTIVEDLLGGLNSKVSEGGTNFSVGQRQLVCLARAIVRNNKILVLDEATANVDPQTDALIQNTIRNKFQRCTVLTIAHRLNTVMDSDKVLVMDAGKMVEMDHPYKLLKNKDGFLYKMVEQTGQATAKLLHKAAAESFKMKQSTDITPIKLIDLDTDDA